MNYMMAVTLLGAVLVGVSASNQGQYPSQVGGDSSWGGSFGSQPAFGGNSLKNYGTQGASRGFGSQISSSTYGRQGQAGWTSGGYSRSSGQQFPRSYSQRFPGSNSLSFGNQGFSGSYRGQGSFGFQGISGSQGSNGRPFNIDRNQGSFGGFGHQSSAGYQRYGSSFNSQNVVNPSRSPYGAQQGQSFSQQRGIPYGTQQANSGFQW